MEWRANLYILYLLVIHFIVVGADAVAAAVRLLAVVVAARLDARVLHREFTLMRTLANVVYRHRLTTDVLRWKFGLFALVHHIMCAWSRGAMESSAYTVNSQIHLLPFCCQ